MAEELAVWTQIEPCLQTPLNSNVGDPAWSDAQLQRETRLKNEVLGCLSEALKADANKAFADNRANPATGCRPNSRDLFKWLIGKFRLADIEQVEEIKQDLDLQKYSWKASGKNFHEWILALQQKMDRVAARSFPTPELYDKTLRNRIKNNVKPGTVLNLETFIRDQMVNGVTRPGHSVQQDFIPGVLKRMLTHLTELNKDPKAAVEVFCVEHEEESEAMVVELQAKLKAAQSKNNTLNSQLKTVQANLAEAQSNANCPEAGQQDVYWGNYQNSNHNSDWCRWCANYWKSLNALHSNKWRCYHKESDCWNKKAVQKKKDNKGGGKNNGGASSSTWRGASNSRATGKSNKGGGKRAATPKSGGKGGKGKKSGGRTPRKGGKGGKKGVRK